VSKARKGVTKRRRSQRKLGKRRLVSLPTREEGAGSSRGHFVLVSMELPLQERQTLYS